MKKTIILCVVALVALMPAELLAQEHKRVEVTTTYNPEVAPATKLTAPAVISDSPAIDPEIGYAIEPETWQIELESHEIKPTRSSFWDFDRAKRFFGELGVGYELGTRASLHYATENVRFGYLGCGIDHTGNFAPKRSADGQLRNMADSYDMRNRVYVGGGVFAGNQLFEAGLEYNYNILNSYAAPVVEPDNLHFHDLGLRLRYGDDFVNLSRLNFAIEAHGGLWAHILPPQGCVVLSEREFSVGGSVRLARQFGKNRVELNGEYDMWQTINDSYRDMRFGLTAGYARKFGFVSVDAALGYMYDKVCERAKASHFVKPRVKVLFNTGLQAITPYVELRTSVSQNGVSSLYKENPFIDFYASKSTLMAMPNTRSYDLAFGFSGSAASSRLEYHLYLGANFMRNDVLWYLNKSYMFEVATADNNRLFAGVELGYKPVGGLLIAGSFYGQIDNVSSPYVVDDAPMNAKLRVEYKIKRWKFYVSGDYMAKREWSGTIDEESGEVPIAFTAKPSVDLRAGISARVAKYVEVYIDGYNLINNKIYNYAYYYRNGIGFMAGVKFDF